MEALSQLRIYRPPSPPPLKSGHLDIKDVQCAENKDGRKISCHIISGWDVTGVKKARFGHQTFNFIQKLPNLHVRFELI